MPWLKILPIKITKTLLHKIVTRKLGVSGLTPIIPATWEVEIGRIKVQGQLRKIVLETPSPK
jgi:hypothetical protein